MALNKTPVKLNSKQQIKELQVCNCVVLELLEDGVERDILVNREFSKDNLNKTFAWRTVGFDKTIVFCGEDCMDAGPSVAPSIESLLLKNKNCFITGAYQISAIIDPVFLWRETS